MKQKVTTVSVCPETHSTHIERRLLGGRQVEMYHFNLIKGTSIYLLTMQAALSVRKW